MPNCYICKKPLSEDLNEFTICLDGDEMEKLGLLDSSEIRDEHKVLVMLCLPCGWQQGVSKTAQEMRDECDEMEKNEPVQ